MEARCLMCCREVLAEHRVKEESWWAAIEKRDKSGDDSRAGRE